MRGNVHGTGDGDDFRQWYRDIPIVTKFLVTSTLLTGSLFSFKMLDAGNMLFLWPLVKEKFQIWRLVTPFIFAGGFSFNFVMHLIVLYENCKRYEANPFNSGGGGNSSDFIFMIIFGMIVHLLVAYIFNLMLLSDCLANMIIYVWSRRDPDTILSFWGFKLKALYLPWAYLFIRMVMGNSIVDPVIGICVGHLYFFLVHVLRDTHGYTLLKTPQFCIAIANSYTGITGARGAANTTTGAYYVPPSRRGQQEPQVGANPQGPQRRHAWGRGNVLGTG